MQQLIVSYAQSEKPFSVLKVADLDKTTKSNELLNLLSETAEKVGDFTKAIEFEKAKTEGINEARIKHLKESKDAQNNRVTDFTVDLQNVRK